MKRIFIDIETIPSIEPPQGKKLKKGETPEEQHRATSLDPNYGRILCIGYSISTDPEDMDALGILNNSLSIHAADDLIGYGNLLKKFYLDETEILREFWSIFTEYQFDLKQDLIIGHNLLNFDLPFILKRSIINRVKPTLNLPLRKYQSRPIYDTMQEWNTWNGSMIGLGALAEILGIDNTKNNHDITGEKLFEAYQAGKHIEIAKYCMDDINLTEKIYNRMNFIEEDK